MEPVSVAIPLIFKAPGAIQGAAAMIGLVESFDKKLDKLLSTEFDSGVRCINEIPDAKKEYKFLLKQGWNRFHSSLSVEVGERKALAYIGLAFCQFYLGESQLAINTLKELQEYEFIDKGERLKRGLIMSGVAANILINSVTIISGAAILLAIRAMAKNQKLSYDQFEIVENFFKNPELLEKISRISSEEKVTTIKESAQEIIEYINAEDGTQDR